MSKSKSLQGKQQSMIAESEDSRTAQNGFHGRGNSALQPGIRDTKGKR